MKLKKYILSVGIIALFSSCNDDFMERYPLDRVTDGIFWNSEDDIKIYLNNLYPKYVIGHMNSWADTRTYPTNVCGSPLIYGDVFSDNAVKTGSEDQRLAGEHITPTGANNTGWSWTDLRSVNFFLTNYHKADLSQEKKYQYAAEAWFFKAWEYYKKVLYFGDVPWLTRDLNIDSEELYAPRTPRAEVMDSVLWCLNQAVTHLPAKGSEQTGRLNKDVANALKARICLFEGTFRKYHTELKLQESAKTFLQECVTACEALMKGNYSLYNPGADAYWQLFTRTTVNNNPEIILARSYVLNQYGHAAQRYYHQNNSNRQAMGATRGFIEEYLCIDGNPIYTGGSEGSYVNNPLFEGYGKWTELNNRDPRLTQTVCRPGEYVTIFENGKMSLEENGISYPNLAYNTNSSTVTGYRFIKHWMGDQDEIERTTMGIQVGIDLRYGEVLINYAEALYELNGTLTQDQVDKTINELRRRAGFDFATYPSSRLVVGSEPNDPRLDKIYAEKLPYTVSPLLREIRRERRVEMAQENLRYQDLMRWKAGNLLTVPLRGMKFTAVEDLYDGTHTSKPEIATKLVVGTDLWLDDEGFVICYPRSPYANTVKGTLPWDDYRYYFPIPKEEIILNPNLDQNAGWENR